MLDEVAIVVPNTPTAAQMTEGMATHPMNSAVHEPKGRAHPLGVFVDMMNCAQVGGLKDDQSSR